MPTIPIGSLVAIATGNPGAFTEVGYEALTWVNIGGVDTHGDLGDENGVATFVPLDTGRTRHLKSTITAKPVTIHGALEVADAGQIALIAAANDSSQAQYSIRFSEPGAAIAPEKYASGVITNYMQGDKSATNVQYFSVTFTANTPLVSGT
jgi:hypothetical protein